MKFLMISKCGEGAQVLYNIGLEGNDVRLYIQEAEYRRNWNGLIKQVELSDSFLDSSTVILFDFSSMGQLADYLRKHHHVFGGSSFADRLECDREFGFDFMDKCGIQRPESQSFSRLQDAESYIENHKGKLVFKPSGEALPCHLTYCASDAEDMLQYTKYVFKYYAKNIDSFILQDFVEGDLISTELFFDGEKAVYPANHSIECKKFMNDDLGPSVGCAGNLVWAERELCDIVDLGIGRAEKELIKIGYCGQLDLNAIVNENGLFGLEWTPRFGYDSLPTFLNLVDMDYGEFFYNLATGQGEMQLLDYFAAGVRFTIPPYPIEPQNKNKAVLKEAPNLGIPIRGFDPKNVKSLYFYEIMAEGGDLVHADGLGTLGVVNALGECAEDAFCDAYALLEDVKIPDVQYRTDLGKKIPKMYEKIVEREESYAGR